MKRKKEQSVVLKMTDRLRRTRPYGQEGVKDDFNNTSRNETIEWRGPRLKSEYICEKSKLNYKSEKCGMLEC